MNALVVEDEMIIALDLSSYLEQAGVNCIGIANNLSQAKRLMTADIQIVFMDINLKDKEDGFEIAKILRKEFEFYLVFISASNHQMVLDNAKLFDNWEFIKKPFDFDSIEDAIKKTKMLF